jgi:mRNA guanylyltransferase
MPGSGSVPEMPGFKADGELLKVLRDEVSKLTGSRNGNTFPGAQPVSFQRKHLDELSRKDYFLCEKTDGLRCLLYVTKDGDREIHYFIDRKVDFWYVGGLHLPHQDDPSFKRFHDDTLLDGELVIDTLSNGDKKLRYMVFDLIALDGENLSAKPFDKRIGRFHEFVQKPLNNLLKQFPQEREHLPLEIMPKKLEKPYGLEDIFNIIPTLQHGNDGLVFTAKDCLYKSGTDEQILKWKPPYENTLDFKIMLGAFPLYDPGDGGELAEDWQGKPEINLLVFWGEKSGRADYRRFAMLHLEDEEWEAIKRLNQKIDGRLVECYIDPNLGKWRPKLEPDGTPRFRDDKEHANHHSVVRKVLESIEDGVTEEALRAAAPEIQRAWKARHPEEKNRANGH